MRPVTLFSFLALCSAAFSAPGVAQSTTPTAPSGMIGPLVLAKFGSFLINERSIETSFPTVATTIPTGHVSTMAMYVQYQIPQTRDLGALPMILVHGSNHTGKTYEETPDGRMGWAEYFVRRGIAVYVVDHAGRARSGFDPIPVKSRQSARQLDHRADVDQVQE